MRLADWVVSTSLEINNGCLRYLAESQVRGAAAVCAEPDDVHLDTQAIYTESLLARDSRKIYSLWQLMIEVVEGDDEVAQHVDALKVALDQLTDGPAPMRLALRLAGQAVDDEPAQLMLMLGRALPPVPGPEWTSLNELFAEDSALWRRARLFANLDDVNLGRRIARHYRAAYKIQERFTDQDWVTSKLSEAQNADLEQLAEHIQLAAHHMELFRRALSDKQKHRLWYLDKLANALRMRRGLRELITVTRDSTSVSRARLGKKTLKQARKYLVDQEQKVNKRIARLFAGTFTVKPKKFSKQLVATVDSMGFAHIASVSTPPGGERPRALVADVSVEEAVNRGSGEAESKQANNES